MKHAAAWTFAFWTLAGPALSWEAMPVAELAGATVRYEAGVQTFAADGTTVYTTGRPSRGNWREQGGQYCSAWPPNARWDCYRLERDGARIRFVGKDGAVTEGRIE